MLRPWLPIPAVTTNSNGLDDGRPPPFRMCTTDIVEKMTMVVQVALRRFVNVSTDSQLTMSEPSVVVAPHRNAKTVVRAVGTIPITCDVLEKTNYPIKVLRLS